MNELMRAIVLADDNLVVQHMATPQKAEPGHLIIKLTAAAINSGDKFFLKFPTPPGMTQSLYGIKGVSGVGLVLQSGDGVPAEFVGKNVTFYRNLKYSETAIGTWSEYIHIHYLDCVILPDGVNPIDYSGSMVNVITPYAFLQQSIGERHKAIIATAGNSATGIAMLGFCLAYDFPLISIVRNEAGKAELEALGAKNIVVQNDPDFNQQLTEKAQALGATAIFDGVGGSIINKIFMLIPNNSTIYSYGYIGDDVAVTFQASMLAVKNITIKPFSNLKSEAVAGPGQLEKAMKAIGELIHLPHFTTKLGKQFPFEDINEALVFKAEHGGKNILIP